MKKRLLISFSGGRTSAYMLWWLMKEWEDRDNWDIEIVFANTGKEASETLVFVHQCAWRWGFNITWVEAVPKQSKKGKWWGVGHKVVNYFNCSRKGEPFEAMISHLGIPSTNAPWCSDQLKKKAINSYLKSIGWRMFHKAIGIRIDEIDRVNEKYKELRIMYPLVSQNPKTKEEILKWWEEQEFDLAVHPDEGNCVNCWKKDILRLVRNARRNPRGYDWWKDMTTKYGSFNPRNAKLQPPFNFYRGNLSPDDIFKLSLLPDNKINSMAKRDKLDGCSESCEAY